MIAIMRGILFEGLEGIKLSTKKENGRNSSSGK
jgi:hypothetical protein